MENHPHNKKELQRTIKGQKSNGPQFPAELYYILAEKAVMKLSLCSIP